MSCQWCNSSRGVLPQLRTLLPQYEHVASLGPDEIFVRTSPCPNAAIPLVRHKQKAKRTIFGGRL